MIEIKPLLQDLATALQDPDFVRWEVAELIGYLNDGQRFIVSKSPTASAKEVELTLVEGANQSIPPEGRSLMDVLRNADGRQRMVTQVSRPGLDASMPNWVNSRPRQVVQHFMVDARDERGFLVYPPAEAGTQVVALVCMEPVDADVKTQLAEVTGSLDFGPEYRASLYHYALYRAYSKDAEGAANAELAQAQLALCMDAMGIQMGRPSAAEDLTA